MNTRIVFPGDQLQTLRGSLLSAAPKEAAAVLLAGRASFGLTESLLVREVLHIPSDQYIAQERLRAVISPAYLAHALKRARNEGWSLLLVHTHPFSTGTPHFSHIDDAGEAELMPSIFARAPDRPHGSIVLSQDGVAARLWTTASSGSAMTTAVVEAGRHLHIWPSGATERARLDPEYDRSIRAFGAEGQRQIQRLKFAVVGLGGTGSIVTEQLAHLGARQLLLMDYDKIEPTNLNRVVGASASTVGEYKVHAGAAHARGIRSDIEVVALVGNVIDQADVEKILEADVIFCCTDSHGSRHVLNQVAYQYLKPVIDLGVTIDARDPSSIRISGRVQLLAPGLPCLTCQNLLDPEQVRRELLSDEDRKRDPYIVGVHEPQPAVISLNGTVASMAVTMMLATVTGFPSSSRHQIFLGDRGVVRSVDSQAVDGCITCSLRGALGRGAQWRIPGRIS